MSMNRQAGFSMLEVLVALIIIMLGALGMAGIQLMAINNTEIARYQSLAALLGSSMSAQMQGNTAYWGTSPGTITVSQTTGAVSNGPSGGADCTAIACAPSLLAAYALQNWATLVHNTLPSGGATVACPIGTTPQICIVTLSWTENNVAINNPTGGETGNFASGRQSNQSYQTLVTVQ